MKRQSLIRKYALRSLLELSGVAMISINATATLSAATRAIASNHGIRIPEIHMINVTNGWAWTGGDGPQLLLRTSDGGQAWNDVTPHALDYTASGCSFLDSKTAWVSTLDPKTYKSGLLRTTDGGKSWSVMLQQGAAPYGHFTEGASCRFFDANHGVGKTADLGLGSAYVRFFETQDGGSIWNTVNIISPNSPEPNLPPGTIHLCNTCGGGINFYPPSKIIITQGDLADEQAKGIVRLSFSTDPGKLWRELKIPVPHPYRDGLTDPFLPVFFDDQSGLFPVHIVKRNTDNKLAFSVLVFYATDDGGETWTRRPGIIEHAGSYSQWTFEKQIEVVSLNDVFVRGGPVLYVTADGARTWRTIHPNIDFGREGSQRDLTQMEFVDASHGWVVINDHVEESPFGHYSLYQTSDGGQTWKELKLEDVR